MPANQHHNLSDLPLWFFFLISLAGLSGEMWRAEAVDGLTWGDIIKRITLRWAASATFGMCTGMLIVACGYSELIAGAIGGMIACNGADIASGLYSRWLKRKLGLKADESA